MTTQDVIKLHLQGILGPAHLVGLIDDVVANLEAEYDNVKDVDYNWDMTERVSDEYSRVYIVPYYQKHHNFLKLAECFKLSAQLKDTKEYWNVIRELKEYEGLDNCLIDEYISVNNPLIRHSEIYREHYHPHYLVVANKYISLLT